MLTERIRSIHEQSWQTYGAPRIHAELRAEGIRCGTKRAARLMRSAGIVGCHRRRHVVTTVRGPKASLAPDRLQRQFVAEAPNRRWTADITYIPTWAGFYYPAVVLDVFSRRIVGWAMADHLRTELVLSALDVALHNRRPEPGVIHHSDHGCQYTAIAFGTRCQDAGVVPSLGSRGDCFDNAITESFFATLECELFDRHVFRTHAQARTAVFAYIEAFYPFGSVPIDIKSFSMGLSAVTWSETTSRQLPAQFQSRSPEGEEHTALVDAQRQAEVFERLIAVSQSRAR